MRYFLPLLILSISVNLWGQPILPNQFIHLSPTENGGNWLELELIPSFDYGHNVYIKNTSDIYFLTVYAEKRCMSCEGVQCNPACGTEPFLVIANNVLIAPGQRLYLGFAACCQDPRWYNVSYFQYRYKSQSFLTGSHPSSPTQVNNIGNGDYWIRALDTDFIMGYDQSSGEVGLYKYYNVPSNIITTFSIENLGTNEISVGFTSNGQKDFMTWENPNATNKKPYLTKSKETAFRVYKLIDKSNSYLSFVYKVENRNAEGTQVDIWNLMQPSLGMIEFSKIEVEGANQKYHPGFPAKRIEENVFSSGWVLDPPGKVNPDIPLTIELCQCTGSGGVKGVKTWGPKGERCYGLWPWTYSENCIKVNTIASCKGHGGVEGVTLWGPVGQKCGGLWNQTYSLDPTKLTNDSELKIEICACNGNGNVIGGMDFWGPKGKDCCGFAGWGDYVYYCRTFTKK